MRLDQFLQQNNPTISRNKASELIKSNKIYVNSFIINKPAYDVSENDKIEIKDDTVYVSRSGYKLAYFLNKIQLDISDFVCIDAGSSTGGFTQVLIENNVKKVYAVDVGSSQLHPSLACVEKVISFENTDIREFSIDEYVDLLVADISFISLSLILNDLQRLSGKYLILLFKPQFEVGKDIKRNSKGVVQDKNAIEISMHHFESLAFSIGLKLIEKSHSDLKGKNGNQEYFYLFQK